MSKVIQFNQRGHDDFIDFIKAYAIICVIFGHTFPCLDQVGYGLWAGMQVPLFILVQTFHSFKKEFCSFSFKKVFLRVLLPFLFIEFLTFLLASFFTSNSGNVLIEKFIKNGGFGPGSYYPWLYIQVSLFLPLFAKVLQTINKYQSFLLFIFVCEGLEIFFSLFDFPDSIYRLLFIRYLFLIYLGWLWVKEGIQLNFINIFLSFISLMSILYFEYLSTNNEPWFYNTVWKYHRWPCYYYVAYLLSAFLYGIWVRINKYILVNYIVSVLAKSSYEIFLTQMSTIFMFHRGFFSSISNGYIQYFSWLLFIWVISIVGGILLHKVFSLYLFSTK